MTPDQLTALAARLRDHAAMHESVIPHDDEQRQWRDDLLDAAEYLRQCAEAEPVATVRVHDTGGNAGIAWSGVPTENAGTMRGGTLLYTHPQPPSAQTDEHDCPQCRGHDGVLSSSPAQANAVEALRWEKPGPVSPNHPLECLIVLSALRQSDGDWWIEGSKFLADDLPIAWAPDTPEARAVLAAQGGKNAE